MFLPCFLDYHFKLNINFVSLKFSDVLKHQFLADVVEVRQENHVGLMIAWIMDIL